MSTDEAAIRPAATLSARDLRDTRGAAKILAERAGRENVSVDTVHLLVRHNKLKAYVFNEEGILVEKDEHQAKRTGQALYFTMADLYAVRLPREGPGRPKSSADG